MIHDLKIDPNYLKNLRDGIKKCEIRVNDRDYQKGDILAFKDYSGSKIEQVLFSITHIHSGLGMKENYVCLSVVPLDD